eukprot:TRINITY_DN37277_c0_g1_i1.p1 TRINITY_DN37277_c0_g1~~TRINITY_DN37277_c0_g1_i1.p1  ORF type:complete len:605 (+),score=225.88 TRINITY_DN37277_c0_g1_i1:41-1855(+)
MYNSRLADRGMTPLYDDGGWSPPPVVYHMQPPQERYREESLKALHADLLEALAVNSEMAQTDLMRDVLARMEDLLAKDATERTGRLGELENKQRQLFDLHNMIQESESEGLQQVTHLCKESIAHLIHECKLYHQELDRLRAENSTLQDVKTEFQLLKKEGNDMLSALNEAKERSRYFEEQLTPANEKAESLAAHLVDAVKEKHRMEEMVEKAKAEIGETQQRNMRLVHELNQAEDRLVAFEEAAQADINELLERDTQHKRALEQMKKSTTTLDEYKNQYDLQLNQISTLEVRCSTLSAELALKCKELDASRDKAAEVEQKQRAEAAEQENRYHAAINEKEERIKSLQQQDMQRVDSTGQETMKMRETVEHLTAELAKKCQECATLSLQLGATNEELEEKTELLNSIKEEVIVMRDASELNNSETAHTLQGLKTDMQSRDNMLHDLQEELQNVRRHEQELQVSLDEARKAERESRKKVSLDTQRAVDLEAYLEMEKKGKDELSQTVLELQRQTLNLAQEKGRLVSELSVYRSQYASQTPLSSVSFDNDSLRDAEKLQPRAPTPAHSPAPSHATSQSTSRITELEEKLGKMKSELQGMVKGNPLRN